MTLADSSGFKMKQTVGGRGRTRTYEGVSQRIYSPPPLPLGTLSRNLVADAGRTGGRPAARIWLACQPQVNRKWAKLPRLGLHDTTAHAQARLAAQTPF